MTVLRLTLQRRTLLRRTLLTAVLLALGSSLQAQEGPEARAENTEIVTSDQPVAQLMAGNRLATEQELEAAVAAYEAGYVQSNAHPMLVYNLATALHHLDRLPEAILWYRRGAAADDPWLDENLWLARRSLGSQIMPLAPMHKTLIDQASWIAGVGIALAWLAVVLAFLGSRLPTWLWTGVLTLGLALYLGAFMIDRTAPEPGVLLADCSTAAGELTAGTETWFKPRDDGDWTAATVPEAVCPADAIGLVFP